MLEARAAGAIQQPAVPAELLEGRQDIDREDVEKAALRLAAIVASAEDAIVSKNLDGIIESWNEGAERLFGYSADEVIGGSIRILIPSDRQHEEETILERIRRGERVEHFETVRVRKDGTAVEISLTVSPIKDTRGRVVGASKIARDIGDRKRIERLLGEQTASLHEAHEAAQREIEQRKRAEATRELLLREIKHRVKNTLATVQAMARQTFRDAPAGECQAFFERIQALSAAHDVLTQRSWDSVDAREIVERAVSPFDNDERVTIAGPSVELTANEALKLCMLLHELGTNAVKYGALSGRTGTVEVTWNQVEKDGGRFLVLKWLEAGGPPVSQSVRKGFGTALIERAMGGDRGSAQLQFERSGVRCEARIRIDRPAVTRDW